MYELANTISGAYKGVLRVSQDTYSQERAFLA